MKVLELFSGTGSVGKVCKELGYEVVSLDLKNADINCNILEWNYKEYLVGYFDIIWASPPCDTFSLLRKSWIGRKLKCHNGKICTSELLQNDIDTIGLPILKRTQEIINYFQPQLWFIENPRTGKMKDYLDLPFYDVDYCKYSDWGYQKPTRIWTNKIKFIPKICNKDCGYIEKGSHIVSFGEKKIVIDDNKKIKLTSKVLREKYKDFENIQKKKICNNINDRYRIPSLLIKELLNM